MVANSPEDAVDAFLARFRRTASCVTSQPIIATGYRPSSRPHTASFVPRGEPVRLRSRSRDRVVLLVVAHDYVAVPLADNPASFVIRTVTYHYEVLDHQEREILAFHWHPSGLSSIVYPHMHLSVRLNPLEIGRGMVPLALGDLHIPTGYIHLEDVIRFLIAELGVEARKPDWPRVIAESRDPSLFPL